MEIPDDAVICCYCGKRLQPPKGKSKRSKRPNGTGCVYPRKNTWTARVVDHYVPADNAVGFRPVWKTKGGFKTKRDAINYLPTLAAMKIGERPKKAPMLSDYWNSYESNELPKLSTSKQVAYKGAWKKLKSLQRFRVDAITVAILRDTVGKASTSYYTARDIKVLLSHLYKLIGADGWASKDLPSYIILPELREKERQVFTQEEQEALWKLYEKGDLRAAIPLVMIYTGMMPGEMQKLRVENIDIEAQTITGIGMKTEVRKKSPVFLPADIIPVIEDLIANAQKNGYLFKRIEKEWYDAYYAALEAAGCRRLEPYCCRHSTATRLAITEGVAPQTIQRMMRWSSTRMLDRYAHPDTADMIETANKIRRNSDPQKQENDNAGEQC